MKKYFILLLCSVCISSILHAQQLPLHNQYFINKFSLSPSFAGHNNNFETFMGTRMNWTGIDGAPELRMLNINGPLMENMGIGGRIISDQIGIFRSTSASVDYAYHLKIKETHLVRFGLALGIFENHIDLSDGSSSDLSDPVIAANQSINDIAFDATFSTVWSFKGIQAGIMIPRLLETRIKDTTAAENVLYTLKRHYFFHASYSFNFHRDWEAEPLIMIRQTAASPFFIELAPFVKYKKKVWMGLAYRFGGDSFGVTAGGVVYNRIAMSYSYEFATSGMMSHSGGTHELSIGFLFGDKKNNQTSIFNSETQSRSTPYYQWTAD